MNQDFRDMLRLLEEHGVDYLVVGGYAVIRYTQPRFTKDLDIWIRPSRENAAKTAKALRAFGVPLIEETWKSKRTFETNSGSVHYLAPSDLITAKRAVGRTQDLADIEEILRIHPEADPDFKQ